MIRPEEFIRAYWATGCVETARNSLEPPVALDAALRMAKAAAVGVFKKRQAEEDQRRKSWDIQATLIQAAIDAGDHARLHDKLNMENIV